MVLFLVYSFMYDSRVSRVTKGTPLKHKGRVRLIPRGSTVLSEVAQVGCESRIDTALRTKLPTDSRILLRPGDKVRIYRDDSRPWEGSFTTTPIFSEEVWVTDGTKVESSPLSVVIPSEAGARDGDYARL